ncbi:hypothetical protein Hypma_002728 [Hypsizygus marmoreus]|uniref:T6SS Phospholipase effector Tle1-like catalytic domain-containing protein n=1 Tax=Hypsizygus marmoreus TaxID=39966 RepID=A0A369J7E1_HYPMA|nr:hypothetical protein Hypma_002728 [Hypsizygus marmoreus]
MASTNGTHVYHNGDSTLPTSLQSSSGFGSPANVGDLSVIPPADSPGRSRTLVLCFDGTGDQFDSDNSNIVELFTMLKKDDRDQQLCYYQAGIGTYTTPEIASPLMAKISKTLDEAIAWNLNSHVMDGYEFLMQNYKANDRICIFGFSRGAYTARALAGMIHKVGLLPACNHQQIPFAYRMFTDVSELGWKQSNAFKKAFSVNVKIEFIGVWDTVDSVGLIPRRLPFTTSNTIVRTFRHAVALDEHRVKFKANLWNRPNNKEQKLDGRVPSDTHVVPHDDHLAKSINAKSLKQPNLRAMERKYSEEQNVPTDIEEVWFSGCHCDVGGGSVENDTPHTLARIPLRWMVRECFKTNTGIIFTTSGLRSLGLEPSSLFPVVLPRPGNLSAASTPIRTIPKSPPPPSIDLVLGSMSEEEHELLDATAPIFDQLSLAWFWWLLEYIPMRVRYQEADNTWTKEWKVNKGEGRHIPKQRKGVVKVHRSVRMRMEAGGAGKGNRGSEDAGEEGLIMNAWQRKKDGNGKGEYVPNASFEKALKLGHVIWVD